jgi:hypothetical protein
VKSRRQEVVKGINQAKNGLEIFSHKAWKVEETW